MYLYNTTIQSAELATGSAVAVTLPEDAQQYMYHVQGGSDKVSFSMPSIAEEVTPKSVNITFIQIA